MSEQSRRGGARLGAGRPKGDRNVILNVRISEHADYIVGKADNKSELIDELIKRFGLRIIENTG